MINNEIWIFDSGLAHQHALEPLKGRPVGQWRVQGGPDDDHRGLTVSEILGRYGSSLVPQRYPVSLDGLDPDELFRSFETLCSRGRHYDCAWINLRASDDSVHKIALLTESQLLAVPAGRASRDGRLDSGQQITTVPDSKRRNPGREMTVECQSSRYQSFAADADELLLETTPSAPYADRLGASHSYYCIVHPSHRSSLESGYVLLRNGMLEEDFRDLHARMAVRVLYSERVPHDRIVLDISVMVAIGLPAGEVIGVRKLNGRSGRVQRRVFGNRHCIVRVLKTTTMDMEKPVARVPEEIFDLLGIGPGSRIVLESASIGESTSRIQRLALRALPIRETNPMHKARSRVGAPDIPALTGHEDFPPVYIDVNARQKLGVSAGSAVYARPAVTNILAREFIAISLALIAAIAASSALKNVTVAIVAALLYVVFAGAIAIGRLR